MRVCAAVLLTALAAAPLAAQERYTRPVDSLRVKLGRVPEFELKNQDGYTVRRDDLKGKVWVAAFFYTCCGGQCYKLSQSMAALQKQLADCPDVRLVSISVFPETDNPAELKEYARDWGADPERWWFL